HGDGVALLHPFHPTEVEAALGDRGPERACDVWASLGPIEAEPAKAAAARTSGGEIDPEPGEEVGAGRRDLGGRVAGYDVFAGGEGVGEVDAEAAREVVVADSRRVERPGLTGERTVSRSLHESDGHDPVDHVDHFRRGKPEMAMPSVTEHREQARLGQLR